MRKTKYLYIVTGSFALSVRPRNPGETMTLRHSQGIFYWNREDWNKIKRKIYEKKNV